ncbi:recombinase family protein [Azospirillum sp. RWY-5-1]|uniref:Recombinase family protein n=1 Tax=Azospirillum oleiclasticum TaxID=2735135 RepID=A0ABX2T4Z7_9PROT|nr:recombinase family protein [Azospirillum oleiclasticum]NYZ11189.1 recombinase family protein [Azospirillum oleiclasticum]NYZ18351.1 recombinase family protein [Azospirillum oleiclasticum]
MATGKFVSYLRVSTDQQGRSGLGLEAQRAAVAGYLNGGEWQLVAEHIEVESGRRADRPELVRALAACKRHRATLVVAKLDRLSRSVAFLSALMESGVEFVAVDNPHANKLMVHMLAAFAEHERDQIGARTKAALAAAKARGVVLGNPRLGEARSAAVGALKADANRMAANVLPIVREIQAAGATSLRDIATALNARGVKAARGGAWNASSVRNVLRRGAGSGVK